MRNKINTTIYGGKTMSDTEDKKEMRTFENADAADDPFDWMWNVLTDKPLTDKQWAEVQKVNKWVREKQKKENA